MRGIAASDGIGIGKALAVKKPSLKTEKNTVSDLKEEQKKLGLALDETRTQLVALEQAAKENIGEAESKVFEAHQMILDDPEWFSSINQVMNEATCNAAYAVEKATDTFIQMFEGIDDAYIRERVADLKDVSRRLLSNLLGIPLVDYSLINEDTILVGHDFEPSDTVGFTNPSIKGFITEIGSASSHSAIIAKTMGLPAVIGINGAVEAIVDNQLLIIDGSTGDVLIDPSPSELKENKIKWQKEQEEKERLKALISAKSITRDGVVIEIAGNIAKPKDAKRVVALGGDGVGLFRSEFLFMDRDKAPTEDEQFEAYKEAVLNLEGRPLIVRTLDAGGDKQIPYLNIPAEMNPFLGYRAIRICLGRPELFQTQLKAILRASYFGKIKVMFPMIATYEEVIAAKKAVEAAKNALRSDGVDFDEHIEIGIMVEIPSAAAIADILIEEVDFMSIGTNDLTQYVMAADRMNESLGNLHSTYHPAVIRMIYQTITACKNAGKMVGMCGEAAGNAILMPLLLGMGLDEFSMTPTKILKSREIIRALDQAALKPLVAEILTLKSSDEIKNKLEDFYRRML